MGKQKLKLKQRKVKVYKVTIPFSLLLMMIGLGFSVFGLISNDITAKNIAIITLLGGFTALLIDVAT